MYDSFVFGQEPQPTLPPNEPVRQFAPGSKERAELEAEIASMSKIKHDIPLVIGGKEIRTGKLKELRSPYDHKLVLGNWHMAGDKEATMAADAATKAYKEWSLMPFQERAVIFKKAAALISAGYWKKLSAATVIGQSKNAFQAEIDAVCETADFYRINPALAERLYADQPRSDDMEINKLDYRPLEGFVYAVTPFNFTAIAANLPSAPALMGNVALWKPASSSVLSNWYLMQLYKEAGLPDGVINFIPGASASITNTLTARTDFAGLHFTGSTAVFNSLWKAVVENLPNYRSYPRIVGETGGKDFIFVHPDSDMEAAVAAAIRGAFEYQGQKCSAASRIYVSKSMSKKFFARMVEEMKEIKVGVPTDYKNFVNAVIDKAAFDSITNYIERAKAETGAKILSGGTYDGSIGWFIQPTLIETENPKSLTMVEEVFGPVLTAYAYDESDIDAAYALVDSTSPYALTGAIFARERHDIDKALAALRNCAGNFYINDKPTGAVVGRQPFGGARGSGTNDKAGSFLNLVRWTSPRAIKENLAPALDWRYPFMN